MTTTSITPDAAAEARARALREWFEVSDRQEFDRFGEFLADDIEFIFGNAEPLHGLDAVLAVGEQMQGALKAVVHELRHIHHGIDGRTVAVEVWTTYTRLDDRQLRLPAAVVFGFDDDGKIAQYRIYIDQADLYA
jgi:ketosteroid isomerase-like protein